MANPNLKLIDGVTPSTVQGTSERDQLAASSLSSASIGMAIVNAENTIMFANPAFCSLLGFESPAEGQSLSEHITAHYRESIVEFRQNLAQTQDVVMSLDGAQKKQPVRLHIDAPKQGNRFVVAECAIADEENRKVQQQQLYQDPLTLLGNRRLLLETIDSWTPTPPEATTLAVIMMDLDRFKQVNDTLGHDSGDALLRLVSERVKRTARKGDIIARLGGDEFVVLHTMGNQPVGAESLAKRLVDVMSRPFLVDAQQVNIGASVGISVLHHGTEELSNLLKHADLALYAAKAAGRGTFRFFDPILEKRALDRRALEMSLRRALSLREFELVYQPQVDLKSGHILGYEALLRWNSAERGLISPLDFIPLAEETGEILPIGEWVLRTACMEAAKWPEHITVAVNVSPVQFESTRFIEGIENALKISGISPARLEIEITEGVLISDVENALTQLWAIQKMGVQIAMDDFGTGYSSLSYLNSFPFSKIKIDQSFIRGEQSNKSQALVDAIISLGSSMGMKTLAEGVETRAQFLRLSQGGCLEAQGYLISKPMAAAAVAKFTSEYEQGSHEEDAKL